MPEVPKGSKEHYVASPSKVINSCSLGLLDNGWSSLGDSYYGKKGAKFREV
jgi:hypothetical protein